MVDVGFIDRVRWRIGIHDVLKGGVIKGEGFTGFSVVQIRVYRGIWGGGWGGGGGGGGSPVGESVGVCSGEGSVSWVLTAQLGGGVDLVVALCFLSSLMATSLKSLYMLAGRKMGPGDLLGMGLQVGGEEVGFLGVMVETLGGLLRLVV